MAELAIATTMAAASMQAYSQYKQGRVREEQAEAQAAWQRYNAKVAEKEAEAERQATQYETQQHRRQARRLKARQRVAQAKSGVRQEGTPLLVAEDTAEQLRLENLMIQHRGSRRATRWKQKSILDISKARQAEKMAPVYRQQGYMAAGTSLLRGTSKAAYMYEQSKGGGE